MSSIATQIFPFSFVNIDKKKLNKIKMILIIFHLDYVSEIIFCRKEVVFDFNPLLPSCIIKIAFLKKEGILEKNSYEPHVFESVEYESLS